MKRIPSRILRRGSRQAHTGQVTIGIRREDPARIWERRCPLTPAAVEELVKQHGVAVHVQHCERRIWKDVEFERAGATIHQTVDSAHIIVGIKETPLPELLTTPVPGSSNSPSAPGIPRTHIKFSHTAKGQSYNLPLLSRFLSGDPAFPSSPSPAYGYPRLIDVELLTDDSGKRTVGFGWFAGVAGVLESLSTMAHKHLEHAVASPFLYTPRPHTYPDLASLRAALRNIGDIIAAQGTPRALGPMVFCVTGSGNVAQGCLSILDELPIVKVDAKHLPALVSDPDTPLNKIYLVHAQPQDYLIRNDGRPYERAHYYQHPDMYTSEYSTKIYPYLTLLLNGVGWVPGYPRLMSNAQLYALHFPEQTKEQLRGKVVGDISCDVNGGLEFLTRSSTLTSPDYSLIAHSDGTATELTTAQEEDSDRAVKMMAVDILPTAIPLDASEAFSKAFMPYVKQAVSEYTCSSSSSSWGLGGTRAIERNRGLEDALERATIARGGQLMEKHRWLGEKVGEWRAGSGVGSVGRYAAGSESGETKKGVGIVPPKRKVLMLGSGMVAGPAVDVLASQPDIKLVIATNVAHEADALTAGYPDVEKIIVDLGDRSAVERLVQQVDVVISLLPVSFHPGIARVCVENRKHMVTASYISPAMKDLHQSASQSDVLLLNEIGLDPGIDHCSAIKLVNSIRSSGLDTITSFTSFCGGLPAPECSLDSPLRYKFSWSPRGVLAAVLNGARFRLDGLEVDVSEEDLLTRGVVGKEMKFEGWDGEMLEGIANRDSVPYAETYDLGRELRTCLRGTLRYPGYSRLLHGFKGLGLLETGTNVLLEKDWSSLLIKAAKVNSRQQPTLRLDDADESVRYALAWLGLLPSGDVGKSSSTAKLSLPPLPRKPMAPIDLFSSVLAHRLKYEPQERDMVVLSHEIIARPSSLPNSSSSPTSSHSSVHTSTLVCYGSPGGNSAMAKCVGVPVAIAALKVARGQVVERGVQGPGVERGVWEGVLEGMEQMGIGMKEGCVRLEREQMGRETVEGRLIAGMGF